MKNTAVAAVVLAGAAALTGTAVSSAAPSPDAKTTSSQAATNTMRWRLVELTDRSVGRTHFAGTDAIHSRESGKFLGYDAITGSFNPQTESVSVHVSAAIKGGLIVGRVSDDVPGDNFAFQGPILSGTGKYRCIDGNIRGHAGKKEGIVFITLRHSNVCS